MVKIISISGKSEKFDSKDVEGELKAAGVPERVAEEVAERVEDRVQDGWSTVQVREQTEMELNRVEDELKRAHATYTSTIRGETIATASAQDERMRREDTRRETEMGQEANREIKERDRVELHR